MAGHAQGSLRPVVCDICQRMCLLGPERPGACGLYEARDGRVEEIRPDHYLSVCPISIETMPLLHYYPGHRFLQISTTGCNFDCPGCISTVLVREMPRQSKALLRLSPEDVVKRAVAAGCAGIAFLMNDPLASLPTFLRVANLAKAHGLKVGCSSNAYFTRRSLESLLPVLDFINIGFKGFSDEAYKACGAVAGIKPVLRNLELLVAAGVHVEVSVMYGRAAEAPLRGLARRLAGISPTIPLQLMRFIPFEGAEPDQEPGVRRAEDFCRRLRAELRHVYLFNTPGTGLLSTVCPTCGHAALRRRFFGPMGAKLMGQAPEETALTSCPHCGGSLDVRGGTAPDSKPEADFQGGYPFTRALEMVEAMLIAMGVRRRGDIVRAWEHLLAPGGQGLKMLHHKVQDPRGYIELVRHFGAVAGAEKGAEELADYLGRKLQMLIDDLAGITHRPTVYYAMAKPLFYLGAGRMENRLAQWAGGRSLNMELPPGGRPGRETDVETLNRLNPEFIFISAFLSNTPEDFLDECRELGVEAKAVRQGRVHAHPAPGWDFGSPRWVLGLLNMARLMHPEACAYDVMAEAEQFHRRFYGTGFSPGEVNRSFAKPSGRWRWSGQGEAASLAPLGRGGR